MTIHKLEIEPTLKEAVGYKRYEPVVIEMYNYGEEDMFVLVNGQRMQFNTLPNKGESLTMTFTGLYLGPGYPEL